MLQLEDLANIVHTHPAGLKATVAGFELNRRQFGGASPSQLMGVINLSSDSWYRESVCLTADAAVRRGHVLAAQGAAILDVGAESTLSQAARVSDEVQNSQLLPVVRELAAAGYVVSVETYLPNVTRACLEAGARVLNLTGTERTDEMYRMVADHDAAVIICYVEGLNVRTVADLDLSGDLPARMHNHFAREIDRATTNGVRKLWIDPGLGFYYRNLQDSSPRIRHQMQVFLHTFRLRTLGWPTCHALPHAFECFGEEVRCAEPFFAVLAALGKTDLFRTHEVPRTRAVLDTLARW